MADVKKRILIVDDQGSVLFVWREAMAELGSECQVTTTQSGLEALEQLIEMPVDLLITDLKMPDLDGIQLAEYVALYSPRTVVIWITAYGCYELEDEATRLSVYDCLEKPLKVGQIRRVVREALDGGEDTKPPSR